MLVPQHPIGVVADHEVMGTYPGLEAVKEVETYAGRGVPLHFGRPDDTVRVPERIRAAHKVFVEYCERDLGLVMPQFVYSDEPGVHLNGPNRERPVVVFKAEPWVLAERPDLTALAQIAQFFDNKDNVIEEAEEWGVRVPKTYYSTREPHIPADLHGLWWVKPSKGASGIDAKPLTGAALYERIDECRRQAELDLEYSFQVQEDIRGIETSAQLWIGDEGPRVLMTTDQIMVGQYKNVHAGNICPSSYDARLRSLALTIGRKLHAAGFRGYCGVDFMSSEVDDWLLEINPRPTGAHYPGAMAGALGFPEWRHFMVEDLRQGRQRDPRGLLDHLRELDLLWTKRHQTGVVPWFLGAVSGGKVMLVIPGSRANQEQVLRSFQFECCTR